MAPPEQFLLFGDSLTICFTSASRLQTAFNTNIKINRQGFSGYNTSNALDVLPSAIPLPSQANIKFLAIWLGANDCNRNPSTNQYVQLDDFRANLKNIVAHPSVQAHSPQIILLTPPALSEPMLEELNWSMGRSGVTRKARDAAKYAEVVREVGGEMGVEVLDVWGLFMERIGWDGEGVMPGEMIDGMSGRNAVLEGLSLDGVHLRSEGYDIVLAGLAKLIESKWPKYTRQS